MNDDIQYRQPRGLVAFLAMWLVGLSAAIIAIVLVGPPLYGAISATIQHFEDTPHVSGDAGTAVWCKRTDTATSSAGTEGDYATLNCGSDGSLWIEWKTPLGDTMVDDTTGYDALRVTLISVATTQPRAVEFRKEWHFTAAQTNTALVTTTGTLTITDAKFQCDPATTVAVKYRMGLTTGASLTAESSSGVEGIILKGWFKSDGNHGEAARYAGGHVGTVGEDLLFTMGVPTTGSCALLVAWIED